MIGSKLFAETIIEELTWNTIILFHIVKEMGLIRNNYSAEGVQKEKWYSD